MNLFLSFTFSLFLFLRDVFSLLFDSPQYFLREIIRDLNIEKDF